MISVSFRESGFPVIAVNHKGLVVCTHNDNDLYIVGHLAPSIQNIVSRDISKKVAHAPWFSNYKAEYNDVIGLLKFIYSIRLGHQCQTWVVTLHPVYNISWFISQQLHKSRSTMPSLDVRKITFAKLDSELRLIYMRQLLQTPCPGWTQTTTCKVLLLQVHGFLSENQLL